MKKKMNYLILLLTIFIMVGCTNEEDASNTDVKTDSQEVTTGETNENSEKEETVTTVVDEPVVEETPSVPVAEETPTQSNNELFSGYKLIEVDGGDTSGYREPNVVVDVGFGDREYWAFTNEYGQLIRVEAKNITLQNPNTDHVLSSGRYYSDEANVPGTESPTLDKGHVIADSLGGVSNAYNITPQDSILNRHGDQAYMEKVIRDAGGCTDFVAVIQYPNTQTQTPNHYKFTYKIQGRSITDEFDNVNPDEVNKSLGETKGTSSTQPKTDNVPANKTENSNEDVSKVDTNHNGSVTIAEAKAAGFKMPITRDSWLYKYMDDRDGDGLVGE